MTRKYHDMTEVFSDNVIILYVDDKSIFIRVSDKSAIIGHIFEKVNISKGDRVSPISPVTAPALAQRYWGTYVAFLRNNGRVSVARDPSAGLPCYYASRDGAHVFASDVTLLFSSGIATPEVDWNALLVHLAYEGLFWSKTCLLGISELPRGHELILSGEQAVLREFWSPWEFVAQSNNLDDKRLESELRNTITECVQKLSSRFEAALVTVSGGLDSSIVAAALKRSSVDLRCLTLATTDQSGDEREYAELLASWLHIPIDTTVLNEFDVDIFSSSSDHLPRPMGRLAAQIERARTLAAFPSSGRFASFNGGGGDAVFCALASATPVADRLLNQGIGRNVWHSVMDVHRMTRASVPEISWRALKRARWQLNPYSWRQQGRFLSGDVPAPAHPWLTPPSKALPGKTAHVAMILSLHNFGETAMPPGTIPAISPLLAQPVLELCLSIPTWRWCAGGVDRSLARRAFAIDLPARILERTWKRGPSAFSIELFERNRHTILEFISTGELADHGIVDRTALARMTRPQSAGPGDALRILRLVDAEAWAQKWQSHGSNFQPENAAMT